MLPDLDRLPVDGESDAAERLEDKARRCHKEVTWQVLSGRGDNAVRRQMVDGVGDDVGLPLGDRGEQIAVRDHA